MKPTSVERKLTAILSADVKGYSRLMVEDEVATARTLMAYRELMGALACLEVKMIGKPYAGELHVRFDEGGQDRLLWKILNGHEAGNGGYSQGSA